jgi:hypothetical protein
VLYTAKGVASIIGGWVGAMLFERFGSWSVGFYGSAAMALVACAMASGSSSRAQKSRAAAAAAGPGQMNRAALADEIEAAYARRQPIAEPPSAAQAGLTLDQAYAVEAELARRRNAAGHATQAGKVGFANKRCGA